jgi:hypothetical protein
MSCYLRHLRAELEQVGIDIDDMDRKRLDQAIHKVVGVGYKDCPNAWKKVKTKMAKDKKAFLAEVRKELDG